MSAGLIYMAAALAGLIAGIHAVRFLVEPASTLRLTIFRPYRGDPWPRGVQEPDVVPFDLTGPAPTPPPIVPDWAEIVVTEPATAASGPVGATSIEDVSGALVQVEPVHSVVHRAPH